jgi:hypothetical protein
MAQGGGEIVDSARYVLIYDPGGWTERQIWSDSLGPLIQELQKESGGLIWDTQTDEWLKLKPTEEENA